MNTYLSPKDLAGEICFRPSFFQNRTRINYLIDYYLSLEKLNDRLEYLPKQWHNPQPRPWQKIHWQNINDKQIIGIDIAVFLAIIRGTIDTEAPIRGYTQTSRQYLEPIHPNMAQFVGGLVTENNKLKEVGLWEKEERQHTPALMKIHRQLTQKRIIPKFRVVKNYQPSSDPYADLYSHGIHRIVTEYAAVCLYLWLMTHTTGELQQVFEEILQDEINHMTKFWGFGLWLYSHSTIRQNKLDFNFVTKKKKSEHSLSRLIATFRSMMSVLSWNSWTSVEKIELIYTFIFIWQPMQYWSNNITSTYLQQIFDSSDLNRA